MLRIRIFYDYILQVRKIRVSRPEQDRLHFIIIITIIIIIIIHDIISQNASKARTIQHD